MLFPFFQIFFGFYVHLFCLLLLIKCKLKCLFVGTSDENARIPADTYVLKVNNWNIKEMCEVCSKITIKIPDVVLVSLPLPLDRFHTFFWRFHCWLWISKCNLGYLGVQVFQIPVFFNVFLLNFLIVW